MFWSQTVGIESRDPRLNKSAQKIKTQLHDYKKQIRAHSMTTILSQVSCLNIEKQTLHKTNLHARAFMFKVLNITIIAIIFLFSVFFFVPKEVVHFDSGLASIFWFPLFCNNDNNFNILFTVNP